MRRDDVRAFGRRILQPRKLGVLVLALVLATIVVFVVESTRTARIREENRDESYRALEQRVDALTNDNQDLTADKEKATAQANTSVDQLVKSGETPIIAAPDVLTVPTTPGVTEAPPVQPPASAPPFVPTPTAPPPTEPPPTTTATTEATPAETTTTQAPPPTTEPTMPPSEPPTTEITTTTTTGGTK